MSAHLWRVCVLVLAATAAWSAVALAQQVDPGQVSEGLKAIFRYGSGTRDTAERLNANTVTIMTGTIGGTYVRFGADLSSVLDDSENLRILPIVGRGSVQGVADILFLKGVDLGIVRADTLDFLKDKGYANNIKRQFTYITKLYNEEMHVVAPKTIKSLSDLNGKTVSVDLPNGGTFITSTIVFERLGIKANLVYIEQRLAYEKLRNGEIDAMVAVQGKPSPFVSSTIKDERFHLVPVDFAKPLQDDYLPTKLTFEDYPSLIEKGQVVNTIAAPAVLAAYNWAPNSERYRKVDRFVQAFFAKIEKFQQPPFHPKWKEVSITAALPGWERFRPAQDWINRHAASASAADSGPRDSRSPGQEADREALFQQFIQWEASRGKR